MADKKTQVHKKIVWGINDIENDYEVGVEIVSPSTKIVIGDNITDWYLRFFPGGKNETFKDAIGLLLKLKGAHSRIFKTNFILGIAGKNGNREMKIEYPGGSFNGGFGTAALLLREDFFNPDLGYLVGGKVTLYCELTITVSELFEPDKKASMVQNLLGHLKQMMCDELFAYFEVETSDKKILKAHKCFLAFRSPFFYAMLTTDIKEACSNVVKVTEGCVVMKEVLRFIYTGSDVENLDAIANELVFAAEKYQMDDLKQMCMDSIIKTLSAENVLQTLMAADRLTQSDKLKDNCFTIIARNFQFISKSEDWKKMPPSLFLEIIGHTIGNDNDTVYV